MAFVRPRASSDPVGLRQDCLCAVPPSPHLHERSNGGNRDLGPTLGTDLHGGPRYPAGAFPSPPSLRHRNRGDAPLGGGNLPSLAPCGRYGLRRGTFLEGLRRYGMACRLQARTHAETTLESSPSSLRDLPPPDHPHARFDRGLSSRRLDGLSGRIPERGASCVGDQSSSRRIGVSRGDRRVFRLPAAAAKPFTDTPALPAPVDLHPPDRGRAKRPARRHDDPDRPVGGAPRTAAPPISSGTWAGACPSWPRSSSPRSSRRGACGERPSGSCSAPPSGSSPSPRPPTPSGASPWRG